MLPEWNKDSSSTTKWSKLGLGLLVMTLIKIVFVKKQQRLLRFVKGQGMAS